MAPRREFRHHQEAIASAIDALVALSPPEFAHKDLVREMVTAAMYLGTDGLDRGEIKILNSTLKEFRYAFKVMEGKGDGPTDILLRDPVFIAIGAIWAASVVAVLYLDRIF